MTTDARGRTFVRGLGSLVVFLVVLIVPPIALAAAVGWPLPTSIPDLGAIDLAARSGISDEVIVNTLALIAWLAWGQIALSLLVEIVAVVRGRPALHLPVLPGVQVAAARLVAGIAMLASTANPAVAAAVPPPLSASPAVAMVEVSETATPPAWSIQAPDDPPTSPVAVLPTVTVQRHDSYWAIAERCLGDGLRWRELRDLNVGRTMTDGHLILPGSDLLRPGWVLELPADGHGDEPASPDVSEAVDAPPDATEPTEVTVESGDNLWAVAEEQLTTDLGRTPTDDEIAPYWHELIVVNGDRLVEPANPSLIYTGQVLTLPAPPPSTIEGPASSEAPAPPVSEAPPPPVPAGPPAPSDSEAPLPPATAAPAPEAAPVPAPTPLPSTSVPSVDAAPPATDPAPHHRVEPAAGDEDNGSSSTTPVIIALGGLASAALAVGAKRAIERRRRRFSAANPGRTSRPTRERERRLHRRIVANADEEGIGDLRSAMTRLAQGLAEMGSAARPRIVQHSPHHLDVFLERSTVEAPDGWIVDGNGALWSLDPNTERSHTTDDCAAPLLVTLGQPDDDAQLYLDLEADGLISLVGDPDRARGLARSIVTEVALSPLTDTVRVIVVGDLLHVASSNLEHVAMVDSWEEAEEDIAAWAEQSHEALVENDWPNTFVGRGADPDHDALAPVLVVASKPPPAGLIEIMTANRPAPLAIVVADEVAGAGCVIDCQIDSLTVTDLDLTCAPQDLEDDTLAAMIRLLETADEPAGELVDELDDDEGDPLDPEVDSDDEDDGTDVLEDALDLRDVPIIEGVQPQLFPIPAASHGHTAVRDQTGDGDKVQAEPEYDILVRLLGEIRVDGGKALRPKPTAVVAYIALHRSVSVEVLEDACWADPASGSLRKRLKDVMSECRAGIGSQHLPASSEGHYKVGPGVLTDTELFDLWVTRAASQPPSQQAETYRSALELVTGKVFTYPSRAGSSFGWIDTENLLSQWEVKVQAIAQQCIETYLAIDSPEQAIEVANHVLLALPMNTPLTEALMRAHAAAGDLKAVDTVYRAHADGLHRILNLDPEGSTAELHEVLVLNRAISAEPST